MDIGLFPVFLSIITNSASEYILVYTSLYSLCKSFPRSVPSDMVTASLVPPEHGKWSWSTLRCVSVRKALDFEDLV